MSKIDKVENTTYLMTQKFRKTLALFRTKNIPIPKNRDLLLYLNFVKDFNFDKVSWQFYA